MQGQDQTKDGRRLKFVGSKPPGTAALRSPFNPISAAERTEANEANEGQMDAGRQPERFDSNLAAGKSLPALFSLFPSVNPTSQRFTPPEA
jgi:hypothetical protein